MEYFDTPDSNKDLPCPHPVYVSCQLCKGHTTRTGSQCHYPSQFDEDAAQRQHEPLLHSTQPNRKAYWPLATPSLSVYPVKLNFSAMSSSCCANTSSYHTLDMTPGSHSRVPPSEPDSVMRTSIPASKALIRRKVIVVDVILKHSVLQSI